jgi:hypothetical protein
MISLAKGLIDSSYTLVLFTITELTLVDLEKI